MKGGIAFAAVAALAGGANAMNHRHAHELFAHKRGGEETCGCSVIVQTITGEATLVPAPPPPTSVPAPATTSAHVPLPIPEPITCPTPGTYTIPATTVTVSESTTVCVGTSTHVPPGTHTVGGVTTVVETATTVTCPVATVSTSGTVTTSTIVSTEYVCPSAGTYTIAPITTTVTESCDIEYPVPTSYNPGTYTAPQQVITVTKTGYVTTCPYTSSGLPEPTAAPEPAPEPQPEPAPEPEPQPEPEPEPAPPSNGGGLGDDSDHYGITYTPYDGATGDCKSSSQVADDIAQIAADGFKTVRVYSTDCDTLPSVGDACSANGLGMMIGVFVKETGCSYDSPDIKDQVDAIAEWAQWDTVKLIVVGNEALMNGYCSAEELAQLVTTVKEKCSDYTGPFTIAETLNIWLDPSVSGTICDVIDVTGANVHPFFNPEVLPELAGVFVQGQLEILSEVCPGKESINLECGWPSDGECNSLACPGKDAQTQAIQSIRESCGGKTVFFSFENDLWKEPGSFSCEQSWGLGDIFQM